MFGCFAKLILQRIREIVEEELLAVYASHCVGKLFAPHPSPFESIEPHPGMPDALQKGMLAVWSSFAEEMSAEIGALHLIRHLEAERPEERRHDVRRSEAGVIREAPLDAARPMNQNGIRTASS